MANKMTQKVWDDNPWMTWTEAENNANILFPYAMDDEETQYQFEKDHETVPDWEEGA